MILLYIPCKDEDEARRIASHLLDLRLAACANMFPVRSMYRWKGRLEDQDEVVLVVKTRDSLAKKTEQEVAKVHSYEVPCIIRIKGTANTPFDKWLNKETGKAT